MCLIGEAKKNMMKLLPFSTANFTLASAPVIFYENLEFTGVPNGSEPTEKILTSIHTGYVCNYMKLDNLAVWHSFQEKWKNTECEITKWFILRTWTVSFRSC